MLTSTDHSVVAAEPNERPLVTPGGPYGGYQWYQGCRSLAVPAHGLQIALQVLDSFRTCPIPKVARLGHTLRLWKAQILA